MFGPAELETKIEVRVTEWAQENGWLVEKVKFAASGYPDRIYFGYGVCILIEFKRPGFKPDPLQRYRIDELSTRGIKAVWTDNSTYAINVLKAAMEAARLSRERHQTLTRPGGSSAVPRPGPREDNDMSGGIQDFEKIGLRKETSRSSPFAPLLQSLAGRDKEVVRVRGADVHHPARKRKTKKSRK